MDKIPTPKIYRQKVDMVVKIRAILLVLNILIHWWGNIDVKIIVLSVFTILRTLKSNYLFIKYIPKLFSYIL